MQPATLSWLALEISRLAVLTGMSAGMTQVSCTYIYIFIDLFIYNVHIRICICVYIYIHIYLDLFIVSKYAFLDIYKYRCV